jgi:cation:H+ antiporter
MSAAGTLVVFILGVATSLSMSWLLVSRLERIGERLGVSEAILGLVAALAADAPEVTSAVTALTHHEAKVGAGVVLGSNVFNLAALLGLGAVTAGRIALHRKVVVLDGAVGLWIAAACLVGVLGVIPPLAALIVALAVFVPYVAVSAARPATVRSWPLPSAWTRWLTTAVDEEEVEIAEAIRPRRGRPVDVAVALVALVVVVAASVAMERAGSGLGSRWNIPEIITGGLTLAVITSLPNAVAAVYLAARGRGAAVLSTALNSNGLNVIVGLLLPGTVLGLGSPTAQSVLVAAWALGLTALALAFAWRDAGLTREIGALIIGAYLVFTVTLIAGATHLALWPVLVPPVLIAVGSAAWWLRPNLIPLRANRVDGATSPWPDRTAAWMFATGLTWCATVAMLDALSGRHLVLIGLLVAGPCCVLLTGRWQHTAVAGLFAVTLAVVCGWPDGIFGSTEHLVFVASVAAATAVCTTAATFVKRYPSA